MIPKYTLRYTPGAGSASNPNTSPHVNLIASDKLYLHIINF